MYGFHFGLVEVPTPDLEKLLRHHVRGELDVPVSIVSFTRLGLQHRANALLNALRGLDDAGVRAVLVAVLAERKEAEDRRREAEGGGDPNGA